MNLELSDLNTAQQRFWRKKTFVAATVMFLVVAFSALTMLYNLPDGKFKQRVDFASAVLDPVFEQSWTLFAPEPPQTDVGLLGGYYSGNNRIEYVNLSSPELDGQRGRLVPQKSARELDSMLTEYTGQVEKILTLAELEDVAPFFFAMSDEDFDDALKVVEEEHPREVSGYEAVRGRLATAVLDRLGGEDLKKQCQVSSGKVLIKVVGITVPGIEETVSEPSIKTIKPIQCGVDFDASV